MPVPPYRESFSSCMNLWRDTLYILNHWVLARFAGVPGFSRPSLGKVTCIAGIVTIPSFWSGAKVPPSIQKLVHLYKISLFVEVV